MPGRTSQTDSSADSSADSLADFSADSDANFAQAGAKRQIRLKPVVRFAPSPNGFLHLGHAYCALRNSDYARLTGANFLLRIEDIDLGRAREKYVRAIYEDLAWLGLAWAAPVRRQSEHFSFYARALARLEAEDLLYPCFCTRETIACAVADGPDWPRDPNGAPLYPGLCKHKNRQERQALLRAGAKAAWRLDVSAAMGRLETALDWREFGENNTPRIIQANPALWGDVVLGRKDAPASYHLAVVMDDALQGVSDIIRGADLFETTSLHRLLQAVLALPAPAYRHHKLVLDAQGQKLAKSRGSQALRDLRASGQNPADIRLELGLPERPNP